MRQVEQQLKVNASENIADNMMAQELENIAKMFIYLVSCPDTLHAWIIFYKDVFQNKQANQMILTLNRILKGGRKEDMKIIASKLFHRLTSKLHLQYENIQTITNGKNKNNSNVGENMFLQLNSTQRHGKFFLLQI